MNDLRANTRANIAAATLTETDLAGLFSAATVGELEAAYHAYVARTEEITESVDLDTHGSRT